MLSPEAFFYGTLGVGLTLYCLGAGADFGGGVWDLLAAGPRKKAQREAIERAIAPIWEANHVWLIFVVVLLFAVFPRAFATIATALHIPITLALIGIVLRGAFFTFRAYDLKAVGISRRATWVFGWSSLVTPVFLGMTLAALATGEIRTEGSEVTSGFFAGWLSPFAILTGIFALCLFSMLAAVYLAAETTQDLRADFRRRAVAAELVTGVVAYAVFTRAAVDAPDLYRALSESTWSMGVQGLTAALAAITILFLVRDQPSWARYTVAAQVSAVVVGFGLAMYPYLIRPDLPFDRAGARPETMVALTWALPIGALLLIPALWFLFRVFKAEDRRASDA